MSATEVSLVTTPQDLFAVQQLCRDFVTWQLEEFPDLREKIRAYFEPVKWEKTLNALPAIHARTKGAMILARVSGVPAGCIMYHEMAPGVAEVKRLYVSAGARGNGVATRLVETMLESARSDGYREMKLDTAKFLENAIRLYRKHGFIDTDQTTDIPPEVREIAVFMQRKL